MIHGQADQFLMLCMAPLPTNFSGRTQRPLIQSLQQLEVVPVFVWVGFVGAISFMEAWLKFQAPGVSLEVGLGIGKLIFGALNKVEWVLVLFTIGLILLNDAGWRLVNLVLTPVVVILAVQTFYLLPALDARVDALLAGGTPAPSLLHIGFICAEVVKVLLLLIWGIAVLGTKKPPFAPAFTISSKAKIDPSGQLYVSSTV